MISFQKRFTFLSALIFIGCSQPADDESKYTGALFSENIRTTPGLSPEEEQAKLKVPPGFEITLFASEPDIQKPMNLSFDAKGRMWVTQSFDYPFPAEVGKGKDHITILEDTDHDGKADKFTNFSDTLNIPIGIFPEGDGALAFSIPNIYKFTDSNGDLKADQSKVMFGPFGYTDTHGMVSNFIRGYDGWIHACHGFTNESNVAGSDHDTIRMISGNTFRFRLDGSRAEQTTFGQVNPFGLAYDERGYIYSTDSHSSPLYQLIAGGDYPHFAKLEIMAFVPDMKPFVNEATALCGIAYYADSKFPKEFQGNLFIGDVINSRVHRYSYINNGSSPVGKQEEALVKSADPWFRPVNVKLGPDGAIYVADFYNAVIGHYEVPLGHPQRDKSRGRIWRIAYKGQHHDLNDWSAATVDELLSALNHDNLPVRFQAADQLVDRIGAPCVPLINKMLDDQATSERAYIHSLWVLQRLHALTPALIGKSATHARALVRLHTMRILQEEPASEDSKSLALKGATDSDPHVRRAATEVLVKYPEQTIVRALLATLHETPPEDTHLIYTSRMVLRNVLRNESLLKEVLALSWNQEEIKWIEGTLVDVYSPSSGIFLAKYIDSNPLAAEKMGLVYQQISRFVPEKDLDAIATAVMSNQNKEIDERAAILKGIRQGIAQRGGKENAKFKQWGSSIAQDLLTKYPPTDTEVSDEVADRQKLAFTLAGDYQVASLAPVLTKFISAGKAARNDVRVSAFAAMLKIEPSGSIALAGKIIMNDSISLDFRRRVATTLSTYPGSAVNSVLSGIKNVPPDLEIAVAASLATSPEGKAILFKKVRAGEMLARTLRNPRVNDRLMLNITAKEKKEYEDLTAGLTPISKEKDQLIGARLAAFRSAKLSAVQLDSGAIVFGNNCGVCHRKVSKDAIGPPLAGIGKRGDMSIAEKILDPNRNIVEAFRNYTVKLRDGKVISGVYRRDEGQLEIYADLTGAEISVAKKEIVERKISPFTIMPDTFGSSLTQAEFNSLMAYLLTW